MAATFLLGRAPAPGMIERLLDHLQRYGHVAVPLPALAAARAAELRAAVPALLQQPAHVRALAELADRWSSSPLERSSVTWGVRPVGDPRGGKSHVQTVADFDRFVVDDGDTPEAIRAVLARLSAFGVAAERLIAGSAVPLRCTVRANVYDRGGGVPTHVDDSALTVVFTDRPGSLLVAPGRRRAPLRPVAGRGWHAVVLPGKQARRLRPTLAASPHAAIPAAERRLSVSVFAGLDPVTSTRSGSRSSAVRLVAA